MGRRNERQKIYYRKTDNFTADGLQAVPARRSREMGVSGKVKPLGAPTN